MRRSYANLWSHAAARLTQLAHTQAPMFRWGVLIVLVLIWVGLGLYFYLARDNNDVSEAIYRTLGAFSMSDDYFQTSAQEGTVSADERNLIRFAALAVPTVGLLFAFSGALGRHLAQTFNLGAKNHVVIAGDSPAAISLALDCRNGFHDAVILIEEGLSEDTVLGLRRRGVIVVEGDATQAHTLKSARAHHASHVVAFEPDDTSNLQTEAAVRSLVGSARRRPPIGVHVATRSPMLLREAREMRSAQMRKKEKKKEQASSIDPKPFSLDEIAARGLMHQEAQTILDVATQMKVDRVHVVCFGFDETAEVVAERVFSTLWSAHFEAPRITVLSPDPATHEARFRARHREAFAHPSLWSADIAFMAFDWEAASIGPELLDMVEQARGKPTVGLVSTGADPANIHIAIAFKRVCNHGLRWPIPIFMKESSQSEFSQQYARGDETPEFDAYLQAFGARQVTATREKILDGALDRGAAIAHEHYNKGLGERDAMSMRELQAAMRDWEDVLETYRNANRAVADSAMVKIWDAGWRPAKRGEKAETAPSIPDALLEKIAQREHDRWMAERLISGWRPAAAGQRDNELMAHDKLVPWEGLVDDDRARDRVQVRAAIDIARLMQPMGFVARS